MTFDQIQKIKSAIEAFDGVKFYSISEGNKLLIQNINTEAIYEIGYEECDDGSVKFDTKSAKQIQGKKKKRAKKTKVEEFKENCDALRGGIKNIFSEGAFEDAVEELKNIIRSLPPVDVEAINEEITPEEKEERGSEPHKFIKTFEKQIEKYEEEVKEFERTFNMFDENDDVVEGDFIEKEEMKKSLQQMHEMHEKFKEDASKFNKVKEELKGVLETDENVDKFLSSLDLTNNLRVEVTKRLVPVVEANEKLNIRDASTKIIGIFESNNMTPVGGSMAPVVYNLAADMKYRPKFFRFRMGIFTPEDVKTMINEVNDAFSRVGAYNDEEMMFLSNVKMQLEYMYNAQQINDHLLVEMVQEFNKRFAQDGSKEFNDAAQQLAWKNRDQQKTGNAQGMATK